MIGEIISHYQILERLGEGGMGVVYKAFDTKLKRTVALKFLAPHLLADEQQRKRFIHEAQAAAGLTHPHICTIYEVHEADGHTFMVMEYIEGESLKQRIESGPMEIAEALEIAIQVGSGLWKAHGQGIVHRDVKPGNVLLTGEGDAKIVDFGLAKVAAQTRLTKTGATVGTAMYMSPEQATGDEVDQRTDIWSLGVMLYEMLTGKVPFKGDVELALVYSIVNQDPDPVTSSRKDVPVALEEIVEKALQKKPESRFQSTAEMVSALETVREEAQLGVARRRYAAFKRFKRRRNLVAGALAAIALAAAVMVVTFYQSPRVIDSIAVLPFENLSSDKSQEYFAEGITGELITNLTRIRGLEKVSPRSAVMRYRITDKSPREIANELAVKALVGGTVQREGDHVQITAELTYAPTEELLWSKSFHGELKNILALQGEIAREVVREIHVSLAPDEETRLRETAEVDPRAYDDFLRGQKIVSEAKAARRFDVAVERYQDAIEKAPGFARAYAALADAYAWLGAWRGPEDYRDIARASALKALQHDSTLAEAYQALGHIEWQLNLDWKAAEQAYAKAAELSPRGHGVDGQYLILAGRFDDGIAFYERRMELDPLDPEGPGDLGWAYICSRRFDDAIASYQKSLKLFPGFNESDIDFALVQCFGFKGLFDRAFALIEKRKPKTGTGPAPDDGVGDSEGDWRVGQYRYLLAHTYACAGNRNEVQKYIDEVGDDPSELLSIAEMCAAVGENDEALEKLQQAWEKSPEHIMWLNTAALLDPLNADPRYADFRRRIGVPAIHWSTARAWSPR